MADLDISAMYSMFRSTLSYPAPANGWGKEPGANDISISDDIERIRLSRNKICHANSSEMTTEDFNESVLDLIEVRFIWIDDSFVIV